MTLFEALESIMETYEVERAGQDGVYKIWLDDCESCELYKVDEFLAYLRYECDGYVEHHLYSAEQILTFLDL